MRDCTKATRSTACYGCNAPQAHHPIDGRPYCCACLEKIIEHGGMIRLPNIDPAIRNAARLRAGLEARTNRKTKTAAASRN